MPRRNWDGVPVRDQIRIRRAEWLAKGICQSCGSNPVRPGLKSCETCGKRYHLGRMRLRAAREVAGLCPTCGGPAVRGAKTCRQCRAVAMLHKDRARAESLCPACALRPPAFGHQQCEVCIETQAERRSLRAQAAYRRRAGLSDGARLLGARNKPGVCTRCTARALPGKDVCEGHAATLRQLAAEPGR